MSTNDAGANLRGEDAETRSLAAKLLGSVRTEKKAQASRENGRKYGGNRIVTDEMREKMREAQRLRRERERTELEASGAGLALEKKSVGRPRKEKAVGVETAPKRGRGRPKKQTQSESLMDTQGI